MTDDPHAIINLELKELRERYEKKGVRLLTVVSSATSDWYIVDAEANPQEAGQAVSMLVAAIINMRDVILANDTSEKGRLLEAVLDRHSETLGALLPQATFGE